MNRELPTITSSTYAASATNLMSDSAPTVAWGQARLAGQAIPGMPLDLARRIHIGPVQHDMGIPDPVEELLEELERQQMATRLIRVFVLDPNENIKLEDRMIFSGKERLTDLTDQELFFELPMGDILTKHNELRAKTMDKDRSSKMGKEIYLEPVRIRDLKMTVLNIAAF